ncbi:DUF1028 domain-containing protein [Fodinicola feengrottensis]|uniref:DUF1028 domain-containing protein n=1 Tax=Fodinicola feengrottensis TaxID=435914 RepID=UPI0036F3C9AB
MTYSIVARDPGSGELAVAVASCVLAVGRAVPRTRSAVSARWRRSPKPDAATGRAGWPGWRPASGRT